MPPRRSSASASAAKRAAEQSANEAGDGTKRHKGGAAAPSAAAAASSSAAADIHRNAEAQQPEQQQQQQQRCCHPGCAAAALHWCAHCAFEMCASHDAAWHMSGARSSHRRVSLADRPAAQLQRMAAALAAEPARVRSAVRSGLKEQDQVAFALSAPLFLLSDAQKRLEEQMEAQSDSDAKIKRSREPYFSKLKQADKELVAWHAALQELRDLAGRLEGMSDAEVISQEKKLTELLERLSTQAAAVAAATGFPAAASASTSAAAPPAHLSAAASSSSAVSMRPVGASGLLGRDELSDDLCAHLQRFLGGGVRLRGARLLYRATRDGFAVEKFWERCTGKAPTLILVKVAGSGFLIGAFTPLSWPADRGLSQSEVTDFTGTTFLFSLVNGHGRPVKLRLGGDGRCKALNLDPSSGSGPRFGGKTDLCLMSCGRLANLHDGCYVNVDPHGFELDQEAEAAAGLPPIPFAYDKKLFVSEAGTSPSWAKFAAAEIEVYQL